MEAVAEGVALRPLPWAAAVAEAQRQSRQTLRGGGLVDTLEAVILVAFPAGRD